MNEDLPYAEADLGLLHMVIYGLQDGALCDNS